MIHFNTNQLYILLQGNVLLRTECGEQIKKRPNSYGLKTNLDMVEDIHTMIMDEISERTR